MATILICANLCNQWLLESSLTQPINMNTNKPKILFLMVLLMFTIISCAPQGTTEKEYGFLYGLWHGFILLFSVIGKLFNRDIGIHAVHNSGFTYWLGFLIGVLMFGGGSGRAATRRKSQ